MKIGIAITAFSIFMAFMQSQQFTGFLDIYSSAGATWGVSAYKLTNAYAGNWGTVQRSSDNTTQVIGFLSNGKVDVASFNTFCASTLCFLTSWIDQVNGINAGQATLANMPRVIEDANNLLAVCPQPGSFMTTAYNAAVNTAKVHMFAVAKPGYLDNRFHQPDVPTAQVTANVTNASSSITGMSSQTGISLATGQPNNNSFPGVTDSAGFLPDAQTVNGTIGETVISALPTGSTGTLSFQPANISTTGSSTGDTLTFTNAVLLGPWIFNGPNANTNWANNAYWGFGIGSANDLEPADVDAARNATWLQMSSVASNGLRSQWGVWDYDTSTQQLNFNGTNMTGAQGTSANITYTTNTGMTLFGNDSGAGPLGEQLSQTCFETLVLFNQTETSRVAMSQFLQNQDSISFPFATATSDGFSMTGVYSISDYGDGANLPSSIFGTKSVTDSFGLVWDSLQTGGYTWPALAYANNINNGAWMWRFILKTGDSDMNITQRPRAEILASTAKVTGGQSFSEFFQFNFEQMVNYAAVSDQWCYTAQIHYSNTRASNSGSNAAPDLVTATCTGNKLQFVTQQCSNCNSNPTNINCGTAQTITPGTTYAVVLTGTWSNTQTADTLQLWFGPNGSTLTQLCNLGPGSLYQIDDYAQMKQGLYTGDVNAQTGGTSILRIINAQFSATANAYSSYITTQPALPTHP